MRCDPAILWTLVEQTNDPGPEAESTARHLETCAVCREHLSKIGGDPSWWEEAAQWLEQVTDSDRTSWQKEVSPLPLVDLSFLDDPTHPEMLGRIGRYDVEGLIGRGGMGVVLRAYDSDLHRSVAVKVLAPEWAASVQARQRFAREAQAAASVAHENVIPIYNVEANAALPFLVMRYVPGMTLERWVQASEQADIGTILRVAGQLAEGLAAAHHRGLVHRDIKPGNVLVGENIDRVWITDFGLARAADSMTLTRTGVIAGTPHYMSPEQARGEPVDHRSDLFSLGCVLFYLSTGRPPFDADNTLAVLHKIVSEPATPLAAIRNDLPPSFVRLVHQMLQRDADKRPPDCSAVIDRLRDAQTESSDGRVAKPPMPPRLRRALSIGLIAALLISWSLGTMLILSKAAEHMFPRSTQPNALDPRALDPWAFDPWAFEGNADDPNVSPDVLRASSQIEYAVAIDTAEFHAQLIDVDREVHQLQQQAFAPEAIPIFLDEDRWRDEVAQLESLIKRLEKQ